MHLINPTGHKKITLREGEEVNITLEDHDTGNRTFTLIIELEGRGAMCHISGVAHATQNDQKTWHIEQHFRGENQSGSITLKGVAEGSSVLQFDAAGILTQSSIDAEAHIDERIILFDDARAKALPVLRVETDKVQGASHGASIAPIDRNTVLYLMNRGLTEKAAREILKRGFLGYSTSDAE